MPAISRDDVAHLARLARLDLEEQELVHYAEQLDVILTAVQRVSEVAADDVEPMSHPVAISNVFRADVLHPGLTPQEALAGAPAVEDDRFRVPRILDEE
jgi:aspartyl-tRNA(Asn)/glutamyl-tRNA(Gln) amidotransferase subunit C